MTNSNDASPKGWVWIELGEICEPVKKINPKDRPNEEFSYLEISSIDNTQNKITKTRTILGRYAPSRARQLVRSGDILFSTVRTYLKNIAMVDNKYDKQIASTGFCVIRPKQPINKKWIFYTTIMNSFVNQLTQLQRGTSYPAVLYSDVYSQKIPLPPITEQHRIVSKIEEIFTKLDAGTKALRKGKAQLQHYRQAVLKHAFGGKLSEEWRQKNPIMHSDFLDENHEDIEFSSSIPKNWKRITISQIETFLGSGITPRGGRKNYVKQGIPFIRSQNVHASGLRLDNVVYVTKALHERMHRTHIKPGDVLLNITGASIGRSTYIPLDFGEGNVNQHVCIIRPKSQINSGYLSWYFNSPEGQNQIMIKQSGQTRQGLNYTQLRSIKVPLTNIEEQQFILKTIEKTFSMVFYIETMIEDIFKKNSIIKNSILKKAFEGKLVLQDPSDESGERLLTRIRKEKHKTQEKVMMGRESKKKERRLNGYVK